MTQAATTLLERFEREFPLYKFSDKWIVKYTSGDQEYDRGFRFRAMGSHRETRDKSMFILSKVSMSAGLKGQLVPIRGSNDYYLEYQGCTCMGTGECSFCRS